MSNIIEYKKIFISLCLIVMCQTIWAQNFSFTILDNYPKTIVYPLGKGELKGDIIVNAFSYNKNESVAWVYNDEYIATVSIPESFKKLMKENNIQDLVNKYPNKFNYNYAIIKKRIDRHYYVIDSIEGRKKQERSIFVMDSIARDNAKIDSIKQRQLHLRDSVESLDIDTTNYQYPFSFRIIYGKTKDYAYIGNKVSDSIDNILEEQKELFCDKDIIIGAYYKKEQKDFLGKYRTKEYFKAYSHGRGFYIDKDDVEFTSQELLKLDSLIYCDNEITKGHFNKFAESISQYIFYNKELKDYLNIYKRYSSYPVAIKSWEWDDSDEYSDSKKVTINFYNPTKKKIKYIYVTLSAANSVGDIVYGGVKKLTCIGPIKSGESGEYEFKDVWYSDIIDNVRIVNLKVQYMDKTVRIISKPYIVVLSDKENEYLNNLDSDIETLDNIGLKEK